MKCIECLFLCLIIITLSSCDGQVEKINGVSFVASGIAIDSSHVNPVVKVNANYAALMPFGFIRSLDNPKINYNWDGQWFGEKKEGVEQYMDELRKRGVKIMLKPQIWVSRGQFTGYIEMNNEDDWSVLESSYSKFILDFARQAEDLGIEIFCIGTELEKFIKNRPDYWSDLIKKVKKIYKGKLTYAANWDEFKRTPFWGQLDYIGLDAYFPVSNEKTPSVEDCIKGWNKHKTLIKKYHDSIAKPILFTEYGYRSVNYTGKEPWKVDRSKNDVNLQAQVNATIALYETFWKENWFAGGFVWKWFLQHDKVGGENNNRFTPQNKPVEKVIAQYYKKD